MGGEFGKQRPPITIRTPDDLVIGTLAPDLFMRRNGGENRNPSRRCKCLRLAGAVVFVNHHAGHADIAAQSSEIFDRRTDVIGDIERLEIVRADDDDFLAQIAGNRQPEAAAHHIAQKVEQHVIKIPVVEAQPFQQLEAVNNAAPATAAPDLGAAEFHRKHTIALKTDVADGDLLTGFFLLAGDAENRRAIAPTEQQRRGVALGIAADQEHFFTLLRHHVGQIGEREALADAALTIDRDDLGVLERRGAWRGNVDGYSHAMVLQSRIIFRQLGSPKAVR